MGKPELRADKINSPIQLMAAWFVMVILLSGVLLTGASQINKPAWAAGYLIIFTSVLILLVLVCVLLMLTRFRPNLQEGKEYAEWLKDQNKYSGGVAAEEMEGRILSKVQKKLEALKLSAGNADEVGVIERIEDNVLYHAYLSDLKGAQELIRRLQALGIESEIYERSTGSKYSDSEAIWLGSEIPPSVALPAIKEAVEVWPHLKYISLSEDSAGPNDTHWEIYFGGATGTALGEGLKPWTQDELRSLQATTKEQLHAEVRGKYS